MSGTAGQRPEQPDPRSVYGSWLLAGLLNQPDRRDYYEKVMRARISSGGIEQYTIAERVFQQCMAMLFRVDQPVRDISDFVAAARASLAHPELIGRLESEALVRYALGERVWLAGIEDRLAINAYMVLTVRVIRLKGLSPAQVRRLVTEAEDWVEASGIRLVLLD
ncbi:hypothetical protein ACFW1A_40555 [Kitasatospora sp. NPDC058965]|uniref:hypothetical protein n=1 Tax=Kitasatospora sp. NPDC058965 TaxID=3346682 RepID=UPI00367FB462